MTGLIAHQALYVHTDLMPLAPAPLALDVNTLLSEHSWAVHNLPSHASPRSGLPRLPRLSGVGSQARPSPPHFSKSPQQILATPPSASTGSRHFPHLRRPTRAPAQAAPARGARGSLAPARDASPALPAERPGGLASPRQLGIPGASPGALQPRRPASRGPHGFCAASSGRPGAKSTRDGTAASCRARLVRQRARFTAPAAGRADAGLGWNSRLTEGSGSVCSEERGAGSRRRQDSSPQWFQSASRTEEPGRGAVHFRVEERTAAAEAAAAGPRSDSRSCSGGERSRAAAGREVSG
ncbi:translation initiation factor IF-2-like [Homo sapiens]|uniref:translation initiation factor IF-2-like n=1 Tax=Homo sapiens TaxID=9606 RepID=UPI001FB0FA0D|nr:translation initiation factor IF-2-like [Homo sapiens]XP_054184905.1 translation initiation factor IF-2-like [Homo sapiens]